MRPRPALLALTLGLLLSAPQLRAASPDWPGATPIGLRAVTPALGGPAVAEIPLGVHAWAPAPSAPDDAMSALQAEGMPVAQVLTLPALAADSLEGPTLDSLHMSPWERVWWGRKGLFRLSGLFPTHADPADDFRQIAGVRRWMLSKHQILGLATVAAMAGTVIGGQLAISGHDSKFHTTIAPITIGMYSATAALSLLAPPKLYSGGSGGVDTITIHKWLAVGHMLGMIVTPLLAPGPDSRRRIHQIAGYSTFATFSAAMITVTFFR